MDTRVKFIAPLVIFIGACGAEAAPAPASPANATSAPAAATAEPAASASPDAPVQAAASAAPVAAAQPTSPAASSATGTIAGSVTTTPATAARHAVVYLEDGPKDTPANINVNNGQMTFQPYVAVVAAGGKVMFSNGDPFPHNVFSPDNEKFDLGTVAQHAQKGRTFGSPGVYTLLCNLHPNMKGYVVVVPSKAFAKTDAGGAFTIKDVPAGTYKVTAWAPGMKPVTQAVTVAGNVNSSFDLHR